MAVFPLQFIDSSNIKIRWREPYVSSAINERFLGIPPGVYRGFDPQVVGSTVVLQVSDIGDSIVVSESSGDAAAPMARVTSDVVLDFTGHTSWPVYIYADSNYTVGSVTTASIKTILAAETLATVGVSPATVDLSTVLAPINLPVKPSSVSIAVTLSGGTPATITDDGAGNLSGTGLPGTGTIIYTTGVMTGTTPPLDALSTVVITYHWSTLGRTEILICKVDGPTISVDTTVPLNRQEPLAYASGLGFGFMPSGSIEALQAATITTQEVYDARLGFRPTRWGDLDERLDAELDGSGDFGVASRLALHGKMVETKAWNPILSAKERYWETGVDPGWDGVGPVANVSDDFRDKTVSTGTAVKGIVASGAVTPLFTDDVNHDITWSMDRDYRIMVADATGDFFPVYARLTYEEITLTDGGAPGITFNKSQKDVTGNVTKFDTASLTGNGNEIESGDIIQGADGVYYTVEQVNSDISLDLLENYGTGIGTESAVDRKRRRYALTFYTWDHSRGLGLEEEEYTFTSPQEFRYWFQELVDAAEQPVYMDSVEMRRRGFGASAPPATTTSHGTVQLAVDEATTPVDSAVQAQDNRLGRAKARVTATPPTGLPLAVDVASSYKTIFSFIPDGLASVEVYDDGADHLTIKIGAGAGSLTWGSATLPDSASGTGGSGLDHTHANHRHSRSAIYDVIINEDSFVGTTTSGSDFVFDTSDERPVLFIGASRFTGGTFQIGMAARVPTIGGSLIQGLCGYSAGPGWNFVNDAIAGWDGTNDEWGVTDFVQDSSSPGVTLTHSGSGTLEVLWFLISQKIR